MEPRRAWLIDASIYIFRAYFSLPERWHSREGYPLNAVYGYASFLLDFLQRTRGSSHCAAAFDESLGTCFRNDILPAYKASRELPDEALAFQLAACRELTESLGIACYGGERYEADDYIATLAAQFSGEGIPVTVVTRDKDLGQVLAAVDDRWWDFAADVELDRDGFMDRFGVLPEQFADYLALVGDSIDDIPGVPGVGAKTAAALLREYRDLDTLAGQLGSVADLPLRGAAKLGERLEIAWDQVLVSRQLATLTTGVEGMGDCPPFTLSPSRLSGFARSLSELGLGGPLLARCHQFQSTLEEHP